VRHAVFLWKLWEVWQSLLCETKGASADSLTSPIMSVAEIYPTMVILKMGIFPRIPEPECESFALHRHAWQGKHGDMTQFEILRGGKLLGAEH
jgi:hypothetical protein